jgi:predicted outer membrane protein
MNHHRTLLMSTLGLALALLAACGGTDDAAAQVPTAQAAASSPR